MHTILSADPNELIHAVLQAEMVAVLLVLHVMTAIRIGTKVIAFTLVSVRSEWEDAYRSLRAARRRDRDKKDH